MIASSSMWPKIRRGLASTTLRAMSGDCQAVAPSYSHLVFSDLARYRAGLSPTWRAVAFRALTNPGLLASILIRGQERVYAQGHVRLAGFLRTLAVVLTGADVSPGATFGPGLYLVHPVGLVVGAGARIGQNVTLAAGVTLGAKDPTVLGDVPYPQVEDGATLSAHVVVLGGVRIGRDAIVAANSVVLSDVADRTIVAGAPAKPIGTRNDD